MSKEARIPPYNEEAEKSLLSCVLLDKNALYSAAEHIIPDDFFIDKHKWIYEAVLELNQKGMAIDLITVKNALLEQGKFAAIGDEYFLDVANMVPSAAGAESYAKIIAEKALLRAMITRFSDVLSQCFSENAQSEVLMELAEQAVYQLSMGKKERAFTSLKTLLAQSIEKMENIYAKGAAEIGVPTGYADLDRILGGGLQKGDLILIAARPSVGKTTFAVNIAQNAVFRDARSVAVFSLEMAKEQLCERILSSEAKVSQTKFRLGTQTSEEWLSIYDAYSAINDASSRLFIDDSSNVTPAQIRSKCRKLKAKQGLDLIIVDYLQLMSLPSKTENRQQEISTISRELKGIAKELDCPLIAVSQLSRAPEQRKDRKPMLSDLRESGAIEQDADVVMLLFRESYYEETNNDPTTSIHIAKHRNGETGIVKLNFLSEYTTFTSIDFMHAEEDAPLF